MLRHPLITETIQMMVSNVKNEFYGKQPLFSTGPCLFGMVFTKYVEEQNSTKERVGMGYFKNNQISMTEDGEAFITHKCQGCGSDQN